MLKFSCKHILLFAKSLQSCPTLSDPIDGSPPSYPPLGDLPDPGIELVSPALQDKEGDRARTWAEESQPRRRPQSSPDAPQMGVRLSLSSSHSSFLHFVLSSF